MLTPSLQDQIQILVHQTAEHIQFSRRKTFVFRERNRTKPELTEQPVPLDMDMLRLVAIEAVEEQPVRTRDVPDSWHCSTKGYYSTVLWKWITLPLGAKPDGLRTFRAGQFDSSSNLPIGAYSPAA